MLRKLEIEYEEVSEQIKVLRVKRRKLMSKIRRERFKAEHGITPEKYYYQRRKQRQ